MQNAWPKWTKIIITKSEEVVMPLMYHVSFDKFSREHQIPQVV